MALARIQVRRDTTAGWAAANPVLAEGEPGFDTTVKQLRIGDGATPWSGLPAATPDAGTIAQIMSTAEAIEGAVDANDALMTAVADDPESSFSIHQRSTFAAKSDLDEAVLGEYDPATITTQNSATVGLTINDPTDGLAIDITSYWGIGEEGPYWDDEGATVGEEAVLSVENGTLGWQLVTELSSIAPASTGTTINGGTP